MKKGLLILLCLPMIGFGQTAPIGDINTTTTNTFSFFEMNYKPGDENIINNALNLGFDFFLSSISAPEKINYIGKWNFNPNQKNIDKWKDDFQWQKSQIEYIQKNHNDTIPK